MGEIRRLAFGKRTSLFLSLSLGCSFSSGNGGRENFHESPSASVSVATEIDDDDRGMERSRRLALAKRTSHSLSLLCPSPRRVRFCLSVAVFMQQNERLSCRPRIYRDDDAASDDENDDDACLAFSLNDGKCVNAILPLSRQPPIGRRFYALMKRMMMMTTLLS